MQILPAVCTTQPSGIHVWVTPEEWSKLLMRYGANISSGIIAIISNVVILIAILRYEELRASCAVFAAMAASDMTFGISRMLLGIMRLQAVSQGTHKVGNVRFAYIMRLITHGLLLQLQQPMSYYQQPIGNCRSCQWVAICASVDHQVVISVTHRQLLIAHGQPLILTMGSEPTAHWWCCSRPWINSFHGVPIQRGHVKKTNELERPNLK